MLYANAAIFDGTIAMSGSCFITVVDRASVVFITLYVVLYPSFTTGFSLAIFAIDIAGSPSGETTDISFVVVF